MKDMLNLTPGDWIIYEDPVVLVDYPITATRRLGEVVTIAFCKNKDDALLMAKSKEMYDLLRELLRDGMLSVTDEDKVIALLTKIDGTEADYE